MCLNPYSNKGIGNFDLNHVLHFQFSNGEQVECVSFSSCSYWPEKTDRLDRQLYSLIFT